jgi:hypothetical protein
MMMKQAGVASVSEWRGVKESAGECMCTSRCGYAPFFVIGFAALSWGFAIDRARRKRIGYIVTVHDEMMMKQAGVASGAVRCGGQWMTVGDGE